MNGVGQSVTAAYGDEWGTIVGALMRRFGDLDIAEDATAEAFAVAVERWPRPAAHPTLGAGGPSLQSEKRSTGSAATTSSDTHHQRCSAGLIACVKSRSTECRQRQAPQGEHRDFACDENSHFWPLGRGFP